MKQTRLTACAILLAGWATTAHPAAPTLPAEGPNGQPLPVEEKLVALTFDDGPLPEATPRVLAALAGAGFHATFCVLGERLATHPDLARAYIEDGHELANHSWDHPNFTQITDDEARDQLRRTHDAIVAVTGKPPRFFRPPYFAMNPAKSALADEFGYTVLYDSLNSKDWVRPSPPPEETARLVVEGIRPGDIVLLHESFPNSVEALPMIVRQLADKGFRSVTVSELLDARGPKVPQPESAR